MTDVVGIFIRYGKAHHGNYFGFTEITDRALHLKRRMGCDAYQGI